MDIAELIIQEKEAGTTVKIFSEKMILNREIAGCIFGVLEICHPGQDLILERAIYKIKSNLKERTRKFKKNRLGEIFEETLQDVNQNLTEYIKEKNILMDFNRLNGAIALFSGRDLYFTYLGKINTFLIHKIGKNNYKIINILDNISGSCAKPTIFKIFSNVISGQIAGDDSIFFSTVNILDVITSDRLKLLIVNRRATGAIAEIKELLRRTGKSVNFGAVLLNVRAGEKPIGVKVGIKDVKERQKSKENKVGETVEKEEQRPIMEEAREGAAKKKKTDIAVTQDFASGNHEAETSKPGKVETVSVKQNGTVERIGEKIDEIQNKFFSLKRFSQILLILFITTAIFFIQSLRNKSRQKFAQERERLYSGQIKLIKDKLTQVNAKLIIDEKDAARQLIDEIDDLIVKLPKNRQARIANLEYEKENYLDQIRNITRIKNPKVAVELANQVEHLIKQQDVIYLYNESNSLYRFDLNTGEVKMVAGNIEDKGAWQKNAPDVEDGKTLLLYNGAGVSQYDFTTNELSAIDIPLADNIKIDDLNFYGQKLYLIDGINNKIYKHTKLTKNSFNSGASWLTDGTDLNGAVSIAIDGNIWVLKNDGEIIKLFKGKKRYFKLKTIDPPLNNPTKIYTALEMENIYILEPSGNRLIVIDKLGNLLGQYHSEQFDNLLDFVLEKDKNGRETGEVYLLNGLKIFEINVNNGGQ